MLIHLDGIERQLDALDGQLEQIACSERRREQVAILVRFRGISTLTGLGLTPRSATSRASATRASWRPGWASPQRILQRRSTLRS